MSVDPMSAEPLGEDAFVWHGEWAAEDARELDGNGPVDDREYVVEGRRVVPLHLVPRTDLTAADLSDTPEDGLRRELHDGVVHVVPPPSFDHQCAATVLQLALLAGAPASIRVVQNCGVHFGPHRMYVPDITVVRLGTAFHRNALDPAGVVLAVEIESPSSVTMDQTLKPAVYAEHGVSFFWRLAYRPALALFCYQLRPDRAAYLPLAIGRGGETLTMEAPWPIEIRVDDLLPQ